MKSTTALPAALLLACALTVPAGAQESGESFDSATLHVGALGTQSPSRLREHAWADDLRPLGLPLDEGLALELLLDRSEPPHPTPESTAEFAFGIAYSVLPEEPFEQEGVIVQPQGQLLHVTGPASLRRDLAQVVGAVRQTMDRTVELNVHLVVLPPAAGETHADDLRRLAAGTADRETVQRLLAADEAGGSRSVRVEAQPGRWWTVESLRAHRYLGGLHLDLSQGSWAFSPQVRTARDGHRLHLRPQLSSDGTVYLEFSAAAGTGTVQSGALVVAEDAGTSLDRVEYDGEEVASVVRIGGPGRYAGWTTRGRARGDGEGTRVWIAGVERVRGSARAGAFAVYPLGALTAPARNETYRVLEAESEADITRVALLPAEEPAEPLVTVDALMEQIHVRHFEDDPEAGFVEALDQWNGGSLVVHADEARLAALETTLLRAERERLRRRTVELRVEQVRDGTRTVLLEALAATLDGRSLAVGKRNQRNLVAGLETFTAQEVAAARPVDAVLDLGVFANLATEALDGDHVLVELDLRIRQELSTDTATVPGDGAERLELPRLLDVSRAQSFALRLGEERRIQLGPGRREGSRLVATIRID